MIGLDDVDRRILEVLQQDGRIPILELAQKVNLSPTPCGRRVKRLEDDGFIGRYVALLNPRMLGLDLSAFISVRLKSSTRKAIEDFEQAIKKMPEVTQAYFVTGDHDYLLQIRLQSADALAVFLRDKLLMVPHIGETQSYIALGEIKHTTALPLF